MQLEPVIGLEIHVQLKTASKMFCGCANIFGDVPPNSAICPICMGYPGTLPVPNQTAIAWTQLAGAALNCTLAKVSKFDRKSYFYPDLPKGYQISQYDQPFCGKGWLEIVMNGEKRNIGVTRIHLEEDAAKNIHVAEQGTLIDFNRAGTPLMEIVTEPDLRSPAEAKIFLQELQRIMRALHVSDADMEKGQLRCDANISLRAAGSRELHPKTEVKNLNSFRNVERALQYEIGRQGKEWEGVRNPGVPTSLEELHGTGKVPDTLLHQQTRGFNAATGKTTVQRTKEEAADYRYFPEPDIPPFVFNERELKDIKRRLPELPAAKRARLMRQYALSTEQAQLLTDDPVLANFFENVVSELEELEHAEVAISQEEISGLVQRAVSIILRQVRELLARQGVRNPGVPTSLEELRGTGKVPDTITLAILPENFAELVVLLQQGRVNQAALAQVLAEMQATGGDPDPVIEKLGLAQESGERQLAQYVEDVIAAHPDVVEKIRAGKEAALQFLMGQVMAKSKGTANPEIIIKLLREKI